jgi:hypothetical protein
VKILERADAPAHLFNISELDFSENLFAERLSPPWVRLGVLGPSHTDESGVEEELRLNTLLLEPGAFADAFGGLGAVGNDLWAVGQPGIVSSGDETKYEPFYEFTIAHPLIVAEPLVVPAPDAEPPRLFINPDLLLFLKLRERNMGSGIWHDPRRQIDVLVRRNQGDLEIVEIRTEYLLHYLQARQKSMLVALYRQFLYFDPPAQTRESFVANDVTLGSPASGAKAILENWGLRSDLRAGDCLQRRLHLWYQIDPPDRSEDILETPSFDVSSFTLPTSSGPLAPARWKNVPNRGNTPLAGVTGNFMDTVYFRQEVLTKYEGAAGYTVSDNCSVTCSYYWGLNRSTGRVGNELLHTFIGDFAQGVPLEEWPHWKQYAVEPPDTASLAVIRAETEIPEAVNDVLDSFRRLNEAFLGFCDAAGIAPSSDVWQGSSDGLAARQLKWVYRTGADDDEFLKRATLASTLFLDGLAVPPMREFLSKAGKGLHQSFEKGGGTLSSRNLLQRLTLIAMVLERLRPARADLAALVEQAEGGSKNTDPDLQNELLEYRKQVRATFAPLAFLYDLRMSGGLAHPPNKEKVETATQLLGLPAGDWRRANFLMLLDRIETSVRTVVRQLWAAAEVLREDDAQQVPPASPENQPA